MISGRTYRLPRHE